MGIQSTQTVSRQWAIERIRYIYHSACLFDFKEIEENSFEPDCNIADFVRQLSQLDFIEHIDKWTNWMLEEVLDRPFYRRSMFNNYSVVDEV